MNKIYGDSFILKFLYNFGNLWVKHLSILAIPPLRLTTKNTPRKQQINRDIFIIFMLNLSIWCFIFLYISEPIKHNFITGAMSSLALYRAIDLFIMILKTGVFFIFRGDIDLNKEPLWRIRRILIGIIFNYTELIMWFSVIYLQLALTSPCQFSESVSSASQAFNVSYTTMTTIGYGKYTPNGMISEAISFFQVITAMLMLTLVVGALLALLTRDESSTVAPASTTQEKASWIVPILIFGVCLTAAYFFFDESYCEVIRPDVHLQFTAPSHEMVMPEWPGSQ